MYRRYSDDIAIICPRSEVDSVSETIAKELGEVRLNIHKDKSEELVLEKDKDCIKIVKPSDKDIAVRFRYLGVEFDGERMYLRHGGIARFQRRRVRSIRRLLSAGENKKHKGIIPKKKLYERFMGQKNNYLSYGSRAVRLFSSKTMLRQVSRNRYAKQMKKLVEKMTKK